MGNKNPTKQKHTQQKNLWKYKNLVVLSVKKITVGQTKKAFEKQLTNGGRTSNKSFFKHIRSKKPARRVCRTNWWSR